MAQTKTFHCEEPSCKRPFASEHGRNTHMRIVHHREPSSKETSKQRTVADSIPPLPEPIEAGGKTRIIQGIEVAELPDGMFQCPKCPSSSKNAASMATHLRANHGMRMHASQECPICHETFSGRAGLSRHTNSAHSKANGSGVPKTVQTPTTTQQHSDLSPQVILEIIRIQKEAAINGYQRAADELSDAIRKLIS